MNTPYLLTSPFEKLINLVIPTAHSYQYGQYWQLWAPYVDPYAFWDWIVGYHYSGAAGQYFYDWLGALGLELWNYAGWDLFLWFFQYY